MYGEVVIFIAEKRSRSGRHFILSANIFSASDPTFLEDLCQPLWINGVRFQDPILFVFDRRCRSLVGERPLDSCNGVVTLQPPGNPD